MNLVRLVAICAAFVLVSASPAGAAVLYSSGMPDQVDAWSSDDRSFFESGNTFTLAAAGTVRHVDWWGVYAFGDIAPATDDFTIGLFNVVADVPATVPFYVSDAENLSRTATGNVTQGFTEYAYSADVTAIALAAGVEYLLSIVNNTTGDSDTWFWSSTMGSGDGYQRFTSTWESIGDNLAFVLSDAAQVPAPATLLLVGLALAGLGFSRRKRATL